jgi:integrase/recombinase XerD
MSSGSIRPLDRAHDAQPDWTTLNAQHIRDFICSEAAKPKTDSCRLVIVAIRALLRFLAAEGVVPPNLHRAVPVVREWRHASLPQHISTEELERGACASVAVTVTAVRNPTVGLLGGVKGIN